MNIPNASIPRPVAEYVSATNSGDAKSLVGLFTQDALVNDQLVEHWGHNEILVWAEREVVGVQLRMDVHCAIEHHGTAIVTAALDGAFDRRGLPDPLIFRFYFALDGGRIAQLFILPGQVGR